MQNVKKNFGKTSRLTNGQLSRVRETTENQALEMANYESYVAKPEETISDLHNRIIDLEFIPNSKSSEEDINLLKCKYFELQDGNTALNGEVEGLIKLETISVPYSEVNDNHIVELEGFRVRRQAKLNTSRKPVASLKGKCKDLFKSHK